VTSTEKAPGSRGFETAWSAVNDTVSVRDEAGTLLAYGRLVPPGVKFTEPSIGRVLTTKEGRGSGAGRALMAEAIARAEGLWPGQALRIGAQVYLDKFYGEFGFAQVSAPYDEDGIVHIEMLRAWASR